MGLFDLFGSSSSDKDADKGASLEIETRNDPFTGPWEAGVIRDSDGKELGSGMVREYSDPITGGGGTYVEIDGERYDLDKR